MNEDKINKRIEEGIKKMIKEKAESEVQQQAAAIALSVKKGDKKVSELKGASKEMYKSMSADKLDDFASTKHDKLPEKVKKVKEDELQEESQIPILNLDDVELSEEDETI